MHSVIFVGLAFAHPTTNAADTSKHSIP